MRIRRIQIDHWRHFENIELQIEDDASLVCLVGANGTGKSNILELVAACAHKLGLSEGIEIPRGDPFSDHHKFSLKFYLAEDINDAIEQEHENQPIFLQWDRTITIQSENTFENRSVRIEAGGIENVDQRVHVAQTVVSHLKRARSVHFLSLDADRAYPKKNINHNDVAQAYEIDWTGTEYTRGRSFKTTTTLYDEWLKFFLAQENQSGTRLIKEIRKARQNGVGEPVFMDHFEGYKDSLQKVLPHVVFTGVDSKKRTLYFDTTGLELAFDQLSGGEREIAFLVGQIDRFGLRHGLFLLDEPELHLNADLIRSWVAYLTSTVETGQIWLATHSLEAVEAAGQEATFVLERNDRTRKVDAIARLDKRPVLSALSRAVGTPAFSISQLLFVFVEGEENIGERERFRKLAGLPQGVRFLECGSCNEVMRRVAVVKNLANESETGIRIAGIIDRDFRDDSSVDALLSEKCVYALPVHEVENFFIHPATLSVLLEQNGLPGIEPTNLIQDASDERAGSWIFQYAMATRNSETLPDIPQQAKEFIKNLSWSDFETDRNAVVDHTVGLTGFDNTDVGTLRGILQIGARAYARQREGGNFWKFCEGKQVLNQVARATGYRGVFELETATFSAWDREVARLPDELIRIREYLSSL